MRLCTLAVGTSGALCASGGVRSCMCICEVCVHVKVCVRECVLGGYGYASVHLCVCKY